MIIPTTIMNLETPFGELFELDLNKSSISTTVNDSGELEIPLTTRDALRTYSFQNK
jgi:hypothetical protein